MTIVDKSRELEIEKYKFRIRKDCEANGFRLRCVQFGKKVEVLVAVSFFNQSTLKEELRIEHLHAPGLKRNGCNVKVNSKSELFVGHPEEIVRSISFWLYEDEKKLSDY